VIGTLLGLLASGAVWFATGVTREELEELKVTNEKLETDVAKGKQLKASYEVLQKEVAEQEARIAELVKLFPLENERSRVTQLVQRFAREARLGPLQSQTNAPRPVRAEYYTEYETNYRYNGGFMEYGQFLSYISGFDKIINVSEIAMTRSTTRNSAFPATIAFRLSVFVYDPSSMPAPRRASATPVAAANRDED
jgi:Tfp pilus assembly protein PilO